MARDVRFFKQRQLRLFVALHTLFFLIHELLPKEISQFRFFFLQKKASYTFFVTQRTFFFDTRPTAKKNKRVTLFSQKNEVRFFTKMNGKKISELRFFCYDLHFF